METEAKPILEIKSEDLIPEPAPIVEIIKEVAVPIQEEKPKEDPNEFKEIVVESKSEINPISMAKVEKKEEEPKVVEKVIVEPKKSIEVPAPKKEEKAIPKQSKPIISKPVHETIEILDKSDDSDDPPRLFAKSPSDNIDLLAYQKSDDKLLQNPKPGLKFLNDAVHSRSQTTRMTKAQMEENKMRSTTGGPATDEFDYGPLSSSYDRPYVPDRHLRHSMYETRGNESESHSYY